MKRTVKFVLPVLFSLMFVIAGLPFVNNLSQDAVGISKVYAATTVSKVELTCDAAVIDLSSGSTEGDVNERIRLYSSNNAIACISEGCMLDQDCNSGLVYRNPDTREWWGVGAGSEQVQTNKEYGLLFDVELEAGYDWVDDLKTENLKQYSISDHPAFSLVLNGVKRTDASYHYKKAYNALAFYIPFPCGHEHLEFVKAKKETCTADGNKAYWTCKDCGHYFSDTDPKTEIQEGAYLIPATGHKWNKSYTVDKAATYTADGKQSIYCSVCKALKPGSTKVIPKLKKVNISTAKVTGISDKVFTGKAITQTPVVKIGSKTLKNGTDYTVSYSANTNAGTAKVTLTAKGIYTGSVTKTFQIKKAANPLTVKAKAPAVKYKKLKKKDQTIAAKKAVTVKNAQGKVTYKKVKANKKIKVKKNGKIIVKKGLKKGTYKVKIKVKAAGNDNYKSGSKTVTVKVKVK